MQETHLQLGQGCFSPKSETSKKCQAECPVDFLNVWFPAHWAPLVLQALQQREDKYRQDHSLWFDAPSGASDSNKLVRERADALQSRVLHDHLDKMDRDGKLKVDWIDFPVDDILEQFTTLKEGILRGVFRQKAAAAWFGCRAEKPRSIPGWRKLIACRIAGLRAVLLASLMACRQQHSTSIASSPEPGTCGSQFGPIGA